MAATGPLRPCDFRVIFTAPILDSTNLLARRLICMALQTLSVLPPLDLAGMTLPEAEPETNTLADSARMEFQAALQLLAVRAAFVTAATGVAIALEDRGRLTYRAATGTDVAEPETPVDAADENIQRCLRDGVPIQASRKEFGFTLLAPIKRNESPVGFIQLASAYELSDGDVNVIARLADLACVALDHLAAAEKADTCLWEKLQEPVAPKLWHAPERPVLKDVAREEPTPTRSAEVHLCGGCGFPVSPGRKLCVTCEQKPDASLAASTEIFALQPHAGWFAEHGYTVASLIVSALAVAVIFWLRR